ncbi:MAG TPA: hypothetical protein VGB37_14690 [Candidatus Lokiarchaeia archaeon]
MEHQKQNATKREKEEYVKDIVLEELGKLPLVRAYCLYVYHRFKQVDKLGYDGHTHYEKRSVKQIQSMENVRGEIHRKVMNFLKNMNFTEKEISVFLENKIEQMLSEKLEPLKEDECYCGLCRIKVKINLFKEHSERDALHLLLKEKLDFLLRLKYEIQKGLFKLNSENSIPPNPKWIGYP